MNFCKPLLVTAFITMVCTVNPAVTFAGPNVAVKAVKSSEYSNVSKRIRNIQHKLQSAGYSVGKVDGIFGPKTSRAITHYQKRHGLPQSGYPDQKFVNDLYQQVPDKPK